MSRELQKFLIRIQMIIYVIWMMEKRIKKKYATIIYIDEDYLDLLGMEATQRIHTGTVDDQIDNGIYVNEVLEINTPWVILLRSIMMPIMLNQHLLLISLEY